MKLAIISLVGFQRQNEGNERLREIKSKVKKEGIRFKEVDSFAV